MIDGDSAEIQLHDLAALDEQRRGYSSRQAQAVTPTVVVGSLQARVLIRGMHGHEGRHQRRHASSHEALRTLLHIPTQGEANHIKRSTEVRQRE